MIDNNNKILIFAWWLKRGFYLLPCQHNQKYLVKGFGEHQDRITDIDQAKLFQWGKLNIAVLARDQQIILDFDNPDLYTYWANKHTHIATTYTERTPRGGAHVFFYGDTPAGLVLVDGVEIKRVCVVAPSVVGGRSYTPGAGEILRADPSEIFSSLSKPGTNTVYRLQANQDRTRKNTFAPGSQIERIKQHYTVLQIMGIYHPEIELYQRGKVITCKCPFHDDKKPSFYILPDLGIWGCHACHIRGDVINLYARFEHIENREAITRMSRSLGEGTR